MSESVDQLRWLAGQMRRVLGEYFAGNVEVPMFVDRLETLINALAGFADSTWVEEKHVIRGQMEIPYAVSLDEGRSELTADERRSVDEAAEALRAMLEEYE
jgi:hypothetical protein